MPALSPFTGNLIRHTTATILLTLLAGTAPAQSGEYEIQALTAEGKTHMMALGSQLKEALQAAMTTGGPMKAIEVCHLQAPAITASVNSGSAWEVRRTSLKTRNPDNAPDAWERTHLEQFEREVAAGKDPEKLMVAEVVEMDGKPVFRMMKAIPAGEVCLKCHGDPGRMAPELRERIRRLYPEDQATGFRAGDLRGAFSLKKPL